MTSIDLITSLGKAVVAAWGDLPTQAQHCLFEAAVRTSGEQARDKLAIFLHQQHPRTSGGNRLREVPEPDSLGG